MAQKAEEYGSHDKTFEIAVDRHGSRHRRRRPDAAGARGRGRRHLAHVPDEGPADSGLGEAGRQPRAATGHAAIFWLDEQPRPRPRTDREGTALSEGPRHVRARHPDHVPRRGDALHARARPRRPRHDFGDRQRAARLPHRPLPDSRARHEREDALDRAAARMAADSSRPAPAARRRNTCSSSCRRTTCGGTRWESFWRWRCRSRTSAQDRQRKALVVAERSIRPTASSSTTTSRRSARSARSTIAAATSISRCTGRGPSPIRRRTPLCGDVQPVAEARAERGDESSRELIARAGQARRHRRVLPSGPGADVEGHAAERDVQCHRGSAEYIVSGLSRTGSRTASHPACRERPRLCTGGRSRP